VASRLTTETRRVKVLQINISSHLGLTADQAGDESCIRRYASIKGVTLPDDIAIEVELSDQPHVAFIVHVFEDPDM